jgi:hypothetical protein
METEASRQNAKQCLSGMGGCIGCWPRSRRCAILRRLPLAAVGGDGCLLLAVEGGFDDPVDVTIVDTRCLMAHR